MSPPFKDELELIGGVIVPSELGLLLLPEAGLLPAGAPPLAVPAEVPGVPAAEPGVPAPVPGVPATVPGVPAAVDVELPVDAPVVPEVCPVTAAYLAAAAEAATAAAPADPAGGIAIRQLHSTTGHEEKVQSPVQLAVL